MSTVVHSRAQIEAMLQRGLVPQTDNRDALIELGFERASPQLKSGYEATVWERSRDHAHPSTGGLRRFVRERAILVSGQNIAR